MQRVGLRIDACVAGDGVARRGSNLTPTVWSDSWLCAWYCRMQPESLLQDRGEQRQCIDILCVRQVAA